MTSLELLNLSFADKLKGVWLSGVKGEGEFKRWHRNGQLWFHCYFKNDKMEGEFKEWYDNAQIKTHCFFKNGKKEGEYKQWMDNGHLRIHCYYKDDKLDGEYKELDYNNRISKHYLYEDGIVKMDLRSKSLLAKPNSDLPQYFMKYCVPIRIRGNYYMVDIQIPTKSQQLSDHFGCRMKAKSFWILDRMLPRELGVLNSMYEYCSNFVPEET
jgi:hypothetical protein